MRQQMCLQKGLTRKITIRPCPDENLTVSLKKNEYYSHFEELRCSLLTVFEYFS